MASERSDPFTGRFRFDKYTADPGKVKVWCTEWCFMFELPGRCTLDPETLQQIWPLKSHDTSPFFCDMVLFEKSTQGLVFSSSWGHWKRNSDHLHFMPALHLSDSLHALTFWTSRVRWYLCSLLLFKWYLVKYRYFSGHSKRRKSHRLDLAFLWIASLRLYRYKIRYSTWMTFLFIEQSIRNLWTVTLYFDLFDNHSFHCSAGRQLFSLFQQLHIRSIQPTQIQTQVVGDSI